MCLSLETFPSIIRTGYFILVELIDLVSSVKIFLSQITLPRCLTFVLGSPTIPHSPTNRKNLLNLKLRQASNCRKRVLEAVKLAYANKRKVSITSQKLCSWDF